MTRPDDPDELAPAERRNPRAAGLGGLSALEIVRLMNEEDAAVAPAVGRQCGPIAQAAEVMAAAIRGGGRVFYVGAGTSGRLGVLDAAECPPTFGVSPETVQGVIAGGMVPKVSSALRALAPGSRAERSVIADGRAERALHRALHEGAGTGFRLA